MLLSRVYVGALPAVVLMRLCSIKKCSWPQVTDVKLTDSICLRIQCVVFCEDSFVTIRHLSYLPTLILIRGRYSRWLDSFFLRPLSSASHVSWCVCPKLHLYLFTTFKRRSVCAELVNIKVSIGKDLDNAHCYNSIMSVRNAGEANS